MPEHEYDGTDMALAHCKQTIESLRKSLELLLADATYAETHPECHNKVWFKRMKIQAQLGLDIAPSQEA